MEIIQNNKAVKIEDKSTQRPENLMHLVKKLEFDKSNDDAFDSLFDFSLSIWLTKLLPDQEKVFHNYFIQLKKAGLLVHLDMIKQVVNLFFKININPTKLLLKVEFLRLKYWL